jgi:signal transduction histidine kinase
MNSDDWTVYNSLIAVTKYDPVGHCLYANDAALDLLKLPSYEGPAEFYQVPTASFWPQIFQLKTGESKLIAWPLSAPQPSCWLLWTAFHTSEENATLYFQITDQTTLGRTNMYWHNQGQLSAIGQAMVGICHEVNQPLNAMRLRLYGLQTMNKSLGIDQMDDHLTALDAQVGRCASTVSNMLEIVGHQSINLGNIDAEKSVERIVQLLKYQLELQNIQLCYISSSTSISSNLFVFSQSQRLEQVLINLINNARDALVEQPPPDAPAIINLSLAIENNDGIDEVVINVTDNGPGIPIELQEQVFKAYYTTKSSQQGTGLGLALSRDLMHDLGGKLTLISVSGKTTFSLRLPTVTNEVPLAIKQEPLAIKQEPLAIKQDQLASKKSH